MRDTEILLAMGGETTNSKMDNNMRRKHKPTGSALHNDVEVILIIGGSRRTIFLCNVSHIHNSLSHGCVCVIDILGSELPDAF